VPRDQFFQFSWRPRAPSLLPKEAEADIARRLKEFSKRYDEEDSDILKQARLFMCRTSPGSSQLTFRL
jgi:translation initiation factor 3 subunit B